MARLQQSQIARKQEHGVQASVTLLDTSQRRLRQLNGRYFTARQQIRRLGNGQVVQFVTLHQTALAFRSSLGADQRPESVEDGLDFEKVALAVGRVGEHFRSRPGWCNGVIAHHVSNGNRVSGRFYAVGIHLLKLGNVREDRGELACHFVNLRLGETNVREAGDALDDAAIYGHAACS